MLIIYVGNLYFARYFMITEIEFKTLGENAKNFKYSFFEYYDYDEIADTNIICNDEKLILLFKESKETTYVYFATNNAEHIINSLKDISNDIQIGFVPLDFVNLLENAEFIVWSEWIDFFNNDIVNTQIAFKDYNAIQFLKNDEQYYIKDMADMCVGLSRGFTAEKEEWFIDWLKDNDIIIIKDEKSLIGYCCVSIYDNGNIVWVRRIAVKPEYQSKGYGKILVEQALVYGIYKKAKRSFLHVDILNTNAVALYKKCGFVPQSDRGEITMKRLNMRNE